MELNQNVLDELISYLKNTRYKNKIQDLKLEYCTDEDGSYIYLVCIKIKKSQKEQGYGSAVMSEIIQLADQHNVRIRLYATNIFGAELKRLHGFYQKLGFILIKKPNDGEMLYYPQKNRKKIVTNPDIIRIIVV
jgi:GNAT superfamily N-acetyltransferase